MLGDALCWDIICLINGTKISEVDTALICFTDEKIESQIKKFTQVSMGSSPVLTATKASALTLLQGGIYTQLSGFKGGQRDYLDLELTNPCVNKKQKLLGLNGSWLFSLLDNPGS